MGSIVARLVKRRSPALAKGRVCTHCSNKTSQSGETKKGGKCLSLSIILGNVVGIRTHAKLGVWTLELCMALHYTYLAKVVQILARSSFYPPTCKDEPMSTYIRTYIHIPKPNQTVYLFSNL